MATTKTLTETTITTTNGTVYSFARINNDVNGNPRYVVHFLDLGLNGHESTPVTKSVGLKKWQSNKLYGGGFIFQSYNLHDSAKAFEAAGLK